MNKNKMKFILIIIFPNGLVEINKRFLRIVLTCLNNMKEFLIKKLAYFIQRKKPPTLIESNKN